MRGNALKARLLAESSHRFRKGVEELNKEYDVDNFEQIITTSSNIN